MSIKNISFRKELSQLRINNHYRLVERGRYCSPRLPREERLLNGQSARNVNYKMKNISSLIVRSTTRIETH